MPADHLPLRVEAIDAWNRRPVYLARIVNSETTPVVVRWVRAFKVGKRISFAKLSDFQGDTPRQWRSGVIWRIERDCLHLTRT